MGQIKCDITQKRKERGVTENYKTIKPEAVPQKCSIKEVFIEILQNSRRDFFAGVFF